MTPILALELLLATNCAFLGRCPSKLPCNNGLLGGAHRYHQSSSLSGVGSSITNSHLQPSRRRSGVHKIQLSAINENYLNINDQTTRNKTTITFVTGNKRKLEEVKQIIQGGDSSTTAIFPFELTNEEIDLPELQGDDPIAIAREKCRMACDKVGGPVITEDTSLCFTALQGLPGPYIKWFLTKCGHEGLNNMIAFSQDKSAYAQTVFAFCPRPGADVQTFDGRTHGIIVPARGPTDFGWDPIFEPLESNGLTYAEMTKDAKNAISHRGKSLKLLKEYLINNSNSMLFEG